MENCHIYILLGAPSHTRAARMLSRPAAPPHPASSAVRLWATVVRLGGKNGRAPPIQLSFEMSSQRGNSAKNRKPAHQNKFAFVANKHDSKAMAIVELPLGGVCAHCLDVLEWRKRMNRFKPIKNIGKCQVCQQRNITQVLACSAYSSIILCPHSPFRAITAYVMVVLRKNGYD